jgi:acyl-CoA synthetase (NDP forming)/RimJ/RimL family protein N-acetyltransferase
MPAASYPTRWEADVALSDGGTVHIRPVKPDDAALVEEFHNRQSRESIYFRYFSPMPKLTSRELARLTQVDYLDHLSLVVLLGGEIIGMAGYDRWTGHDEAEVAFITDDAHHGRGLATVLLEWLVVAAREVGFRALTAQVLPTNRSMLAVFHQVGFEVASSFTDGVVEVRLGLEPTDEAVAAIDQRARRAEARSVERLLNPTSVAVIGAGRERGGLGHEVFRNLLSHDFMGPVYPVNPLGGHVASVPSYPTVLDIPHEVDLAVVAVPAHEVLSVVDQCARKRVQALVVMSAGLHGAGPLGHAAERALVERARSQGMRLIGPESLGIISTDPAVSLHASISSIDVLPGRVGFMTQSGTLGIAALEHARRVGLGISTFIDVGAKADVSGNDVLQYWEGDPRTDVVLLYLESFGNPRKFTRIARRLSRQKPIVAVKAAGARPRPSGADFDWPADATIGAMLAQSGVIRVDTPRDLFDVGRVIVDQPIPAGRRVAIVSNSRGSSTLTLDACYGAGLQPATPIDLTFAADEQSYRVALAEVLADEMVDAVIVVYAPPATSDRDAVGAAIVEAVEAAERSLPVVATFLGAPIDAPLGTGDTRIPLFDFPSSAARVLGFMAAHGEWLAEPVGDLPDLDPADLDPVRRSIAELLEVTPEGSWLGIDATADLLAQCGMAMMPYLLVRSGDEAVAAAEALGDPVVLKATGLPRLSKSESGGVALDVHGPEEVRAAYERMAALLGPAMEPAVVQRMAPSGVDVRIAAHQQPSYGAVISLGLGGSVALANPLRSVRVLPLTDADARRLVESSPIAPLLFDQGSPTDGHLEALLLRLAWVVEHVPELADIELNPVLAAGDAVSITAAHVRVAPAAWTPDPDVRRLH